MIAASATPAERLAFGAWQEVSPDAPEPTAIVTLKDVGFPERGSVHRLCGVGPEGANVVAKRTRLSKAKVETEIYERVLPGLGLRAAGFYGSVADRDTDFCWIFLEEVVGEPVSVEQRGLFTHWLASMHTAAAAQSKPAGLPSKGLSHYLDIVQASRKHISKSLDRDEYDTTQRSWLTSALEGFERVEEVWPELAERCADIPETVVHGDFVAKNLILEPTGEIVALDWGSAGWGVPATDLRHVDARGYFAGVSARWPGLSVQAIEGAATAGHVLEQIARLRGVAEGLPAPASVRKLKHRRWKLAASLDAAGCEVEA